jgi:hypothetical protein
MRVRLLDSSRWQPGGTPLEEVYPLEGGMYKAGERRAGMLSSKAKRCLSLRTKEREERERGEKVGRERRDGE